MANVTRAPALETDFWSCLRLLAPKQNGSWYALRPAAGVPQQLASVTETKAQNEDWTNALGTNAFNVSVLTDGVTALSGATPRMITRTSKAWFMQVIDVNNRYYLFKSIDEGASWGSNSPTYNNNAPVLKIGYYAGAHTPFCGLLGSRGIAERTAPGTGELVLAEYNSSTSRSATSSATAGNNQMVVRISRDGGDTWSILWEQNTDLRSWSAGNNTTSWKHFHCVKYDPYRDLFWFGVGDRQADSGFWSWDPRYPNWPANNCTWTTLLSTPGFNGIGGGGGIYNATDFIILPNSDYIIHVTDGNDGLTGATNGIYRFKANSPGATFERVYDMTQGGTDGTRVCAFGVRLRDGTLAIIEYSYTTLLHRKWYIYTSSHPDGKDWKRVGVVYPKDVAASDTLSPFDFQTDYAGNRIVWVHDAGAGKMPNFAGNVGFGSSIIKVRGVHDQYEIEERVIHPVYWVNSVTGAAQLQKTSANWYSEGNYPDYPLASVNGVLGRTGGVKGCMFKLMKGHSETMAANTTFDITDPAGLSTFTTPAAYVATTTYNVGDKVTGSNSNIYQCTVGFVPTPTYDPTTDTTHWRQVTDTSPPIWIVGEGDRSQATIAGGGANYIFYLGAASSVKGIRMFDFTLSLGATCPSPFQTDSGSAATLIQGHRMMVTAPTALATSKLLGLYSCTYWDSDFVLNTGANTGNVLLGSQAGRSTRAYNCRLSGGTETCYITNAATEVTLSHCQIDTPYLRGMNLQSLPATFSIKNTVFNKLTGAGTNGINFAVNAAGAITGCSAIGFTTNTSGTAQSPAITLGTTDPATDATQRTSVVQDANVSRDKAGRLRAANTTPGMWSYDGNQEVLGFTATTTGATPSGTVFTSDQVLDIGGIFIKL